MVLREYPIITLEIISLACLVDFTKNNAVVPIDSLRLLWVKP